MKKMQYNAPLTDVKTVAMVSMLCASAGGPDATLWFSPNQNTSDNKTAD